MNRFADTILKTFLTVWWSLVCIVIAIVVLLFVEITVEMFYPASFDTKSTEQAEAFLNEHSAYKDYPNKVSIILAPRC